MRSLARALPRSPPPAGVGSAADRLARGGSDRRRGQAEVSVELPGRRRLAETGDADGRTFEADVLAPAVRLAGFDGHPRYAGRQYLRLPVAVLTVEQRSARQRDEARAD